MATKYLATMTTTLTTTETFKLTLERTEVETLLRDYMSKAEKYQPILFQLQTDLVRCTGQTEDPKDPQWKVFYCQEVDWLRRMKRHNSCVGKYQLPYLKGEYTKKFRNPFNYKLWLNETAIAEFTKISDKIKQISEETGIETIGRYGDEWYFLTTLHMCRQITPKEKRSVRYYWEQKEAGNKEYNYTHKYHC
tara:strand:- start:31 stop:606 length:576 start_codon:yes stop_codon:yes gene_type:complete